MQWNLATASTIAAVKHRWMSRTVRASVLARSGSPSVEGRKRMIWVSRQFGRDDRVGVDDMVPMNLRPMYSIYLPFEQDLP